jgi:hypothetical protein
MDEKSKLNALRIMFHKLMGLCQGHLFEMGIATKWVGLTTSPLDHELK